MSAPLFRVQVKKKAWTKCIQVVKYGLVESTDLDFEKSFCPGRNSNPYNQKTVRIKHPGKKMRLRFGFGNTSQTPAVMLASLVGTDQLSVSQHFPHTHLLS